MYFGYSIGISGVVSDIVFGTLFEVLFEVLFGVLFRVLFSIFYHSLHLISRKLQFVLFKIHNSSKYLSKTNSYCLNIIR